MEENKRLVPKRRFKEFKDNWQQYRLEEIVSFFRGRNLSWADIHEDGINKCILYGNLYTDYGMVIKNVKYSTNINDLGKILSRHGDVLIPSSDTTPTGLARAASLEKDGVILGGDINILRPNSEINGSFLSYNINYNRNQLLKLIKGTTVKHIYNSDLKSVKIKAPNYYEQKCVTKFFKTMDDLINLQQQKITKFNDLKSAYLNDMFPKEGEGVPKLRFAGFNDIWSKNLVKEISSITTGSSNTQDNVEDGEYPFFIRSETPVRSNKYLFDCEAVITIGDGKIGSVFHYIDGKFDLHQRCYKMADFHKLSGKFFYHYFQNNFYDRAMKMSAKGTVDSVRLEMIADMNIYYPKDILEQNKIVEFLDNLDNQTKKLEDKLKKLKQMKQAYLNEMFV